jgi:hypothetical protein
LHPGKTDIKHKILKKIRLPVLALAGVMMFAGVPRVNAEEHHHYALLLLFIHTAMGIIIHTAMGIITNTAMGSLIPTTVAVCWG